MKLLNRFDAWGNELDEETRIAFTLIFGIPFAAIMLALILLIVAGFGWLILQLSRII